MRKLLALLAIVVLTGFGCATSPQTPAQGVYAVQGTYATALTIAVAYKALPVCQQGAPVLCSQPSVVATLQKADDAAFAALTAAQNIARTPGAGANAQTAIVAAQQAVSALTSITATLQVK